MHTGTNAAHGPRTSAPSATPKTPALLDALKHAETFSVAAAVVAQFDPSATPERILDLIAAADRALAEARAALAAAGGADHA